MSRFAAYVDDAGNFVLESQKAFRSYVQKFKGQKLVLSVKKWAKPQGSQSMRYYRGVVVPDIAEACGYSDPDDFQAIHSALAWKFLRLPDSEFGTPRRRSTGKDDLTQEEMTAYVSQCIEWAESSIPDCKVRRPDDIDYTALPELWEPNDSESA